MMFQRGGLPHLPFLPKLELPEELVLLLRGQWCAAGRLLSLVDEAREDRPEILQVGGRGHLRIALQPLLGGREAPPARKLGRDIDLAPLRMVAWIEQ